MKGVGCMVRLAMYFVAIGARPGGGTMWAPNEAKEKALLYFLMLVWKLIA